MWPKDSAEPSAIEWEARDIPAVGTTSDATVRIIESIHAVTVSEVDAERIEERSYKLGGAEHRSIKVSWGPHLFVEKNGFLASERFSNTKGNISYQNISSEVWCIMAYMDKIIVNGEIL